MRSLRRRWVPRMTSKQQDRASTTLIIILRLRQRAPKPSGCCWFIASITHLKWSGSPAADFNGPEEAQSFCLKVSRRRARPEQHPVSKNSNPLFKQSVGPCTVFLNPLAPASGAAMSCNRIRKTPEVGQLFSLPAKRASRKNQADRALYYCCSSHR